MFIYIELIMIFLLTIFSYLYPKFLDRWGDTNHLLPEKYLVHNKEILHYFLNPKHRITKHWVLSHFILLFIVISFLLALFITFLRGSLYFVFDNETAFLILGTFCAIAIMPFMIYDAIIQTKFILKK